MGFWSSAPTVPVPHWLGTSHLGTGPGIVFIRTMYWTWKLDQWSGLAHGLLGITVLWGLFNLLLYPVCGDYFVCTFGWVLLWMLMAMVHRKS